MIIIEQNTRDFEYDVHSLTKAFFSTEDVGFDASGAEEAVTLKVSVFYAPEDIRVSLAERTATDHSEWVICFDRQADAAEADRTARKNAVKDLLYEALVKYTGQELPWGDLTGIRPTKIPMELLEKGWKNTDIARHMREKYHVSPSRSALAISIANREKHIIDEMQAQNGWSLYMGIPFCPSICLYCSFSSSPVHLWKNRVDTYVDALCREMDATAAMFTGKELQTVYMGGGTPTTLTPQQMDRTLAHARSVFDFSGVKEFTVEAGRPDTITPEILAVMKKHGVNRISINPQTMNQKTLDIIGRHHTVEQIREAFSLARSIGFDNINMDLIVGLPGEGIDDVRRTMEEIVKLDPDEVTVHSLALKRAARLARMKDVYESISFENNSEIMDMTTALLEQSGLHPYYLYRQKNMAGNFENVGYAKEGKEGKYNIFIMEEIHSIPALGAGTVTKCVHPSGLIERCDNVKDPALYIERLDEMIERKRQLYAEGPSA